MYMSYCRYEGTLQELRACIADAEEHLDAVELADFAVSDHEIRAFRQLVQEMHTFMVNTEILDGYGDLDEEALDRVCKLLSEGKDKEDY